MDMKFESTGDECLDEKLHQWLTWDQNEETRSEIMTLMREENYGSLRKLLCDRLSFGTAGIRGVMRAGFACMNDLVIIQTSQGLAKYIVQHFGQEAACDRGVIIGYDARHNSKRFAERAAAAFLQLDIPVYLFSDVVPTPFIPFGIKTVGAVAGITVTASHNPKQDNGYKVFFSNGSQITSPHDKHIQGLILENVEPWPQAWSSIDRLQKGADKDGKKSKEKLIQDPLDQVSREYLKEIKKRILDPKLIASTDIKFTFTALHGVGHKYMSAAFQACDFPSFHPVPEQMHPDPEFPTVKFPNPEEGEGVLDLAIRTANLTGSQVILANDPDADRCALAEKQTQALTSNSEWKIFNGNEIGALLGWWLWLQHKETDLDQTKDTDCYMMSSAVSSKILHSISRKEGFNFIETLTGFKWMGNRAHQLMQEVERTETSETAAGEEEGEVEQRDVEKRKGCEADVRERSEKESEEESVTSVGRKKRSKKKKVIFAFEEAIGFMCGTAVLDKDGISAAIEIAQMAAYVKHKYSTTLTQHLRFIYDKYGYHTSLNSYFICHEKSIIDSIFHRLAHYDEGKDRTFPSSIGGHRINRVRDLHYAFDSGTLSNVPDLPCSSSSYMITFYFENGVSLTIRTSGTEPKIKYYSEVIGSPEEKDWSGLDHRLRDVVNCAIEECLQAEKNELLRRTD